MVCLALPSTLASNGSTDDEWLVIAATRARLAQGSLGSSYAEIDATCIAFSKGLATCMLRAWIPAQGGVPRQLHASVKVTLQATCCTFIKTSCRA